MGCEYVNYVLLTRDKEQCSGIVNTAMNLRVP
jgi:hypothetical protein